MNSQTTDMLTRLVTRGVKIIVRNATLCFVSLRRSMPRAKPRISVAGNTSATYCIVFPMTCHTSGE